jgi:hypothetical protein
VNPQAPEKGTNKGGIYGEDEDCQQGKEKSACQEEKVIPHVGRMLGGF